MLSSCVVMGVDFVVHSIFYECDRLMCGLHLHIFALLHCVVFTAKNHSGCDFGLCSAYFASSIQIHFVSFLLFFCSKWKGY